MTRSIEPDPPVSASSPPAPVERARGLAALIAAHADEAEVSS